MTIIAILNIYYWVVSGPAFPLAAFLWPPRLSPLMSSHEKLSAMNGKKPPKPNWMPPPLPPPPKLPKREWANEEPLLKLVLGSGSDRCPLGLFGMLLYWEPAPPLASSVFFLRGSSELSFVNIGVSFSYVMPLLHTGHTSVSRGYCIHL